MLQTKPKPSLSTKFATSISGLDGPLNVVVSEPTQLKPSAVVIMLSSGMQNRAGPQRLYWRFAQSAARECFAVMRVDLAGVGDSEAENFERHFDSHRKEDVLAAVDFASKRWPASKIVLQGLCAGARVAIKAAASSNNVWAVLAWSTEIYTAAPNMPRSPFEPDDRMSDAMASRYLSKAMSKDLYRNLFVRWTKGIGETGGFGTLKNDMANFYGAIAYRLKKQDDSSHTNNFLKALAGYLHRDRRILFAFGELDHRALGEFNQFYDSFTSSCRQQQAIVPGGTHTYASIAAQDQVIAQSLDWLNLQQSKS